MKKRAKILLRIAEVLLVAGSLTTAAVLYQANKGLRLALCEQQFGVLSPDVRRLIINDLASSDPNQIRTWTYYFQHSLELDSNLRGRCYGVEDLFALYKSRERPGRSNYFADLVRTLSAR